MGKVANYKRKIFFEKLREKDSAKKVVTTRNSSCCLSKGDLPSLFVPCVDCPDEFSAK